MLPYFKQNRLPHQLILALFFCLSLDARTLSAAERSFKETLSQATQKNQKSPLATFFKAIDRFISDEVEEQSRNGTLVPMYGREAEANQTLDTLVRIKGRNPILVGEAGVGKSSVAELVAQKIQSKDIPSAPAYDALKKAVVIEVSAPSISSLAESTSKNSQQNIMHTFLQGLKEAEELTGKTIILFFDEIHSLQPPAMQVMKTAMESARGIHLIGATTHSEFKNMTHYDDAMRSRLQPVDIREFSPEETLTVLKQSWVPTLEKKYQVTIEDSAIQAAIRTAPEYDPFGHRPRAPFKVLQDAAILAHRRSNGQTAIVTEKIIGDQVASVLGLRLNPADREQFRADLQELRKTLRDRVVDQERVTDKMVDLWRDLNQGSGKTHRVMLIAGPTGAGKTFSAQSFAKLALGSEERILEINATQFNYGSHSLNTLIGSPPGTISHEETSGILPDFLSGRGKGQNVIIINEIDKAHSQVMTLLMEMLDTGKLQARDGKSYSLGKSLVIFTTNKGDDQIYPRGKSNPMTRNEIQARLAQIGDREVRRYFTKPNPNDLYDKSKVQPASVLNRIDAAIAVAPPSREGAIKIAQQKVGEVSKKIEELYRTKVTLDQEVVEYLVDTFYSPEDGVRDLNRATEALINDAIQAYENEAKLSDQDTIQISRDLKDPSQHDYLKISSLKTDVSMEMAAPIRQRIPNPLTDPQARQRLAGLESQLQKSIFGQPEAVQTTAKAIRLRATNQMTKTPAVTLDLGPTGTGKTELGKAIATTLFGDPDRYIAFDMGKVKTYAELRDIFGSSRGLVGSSDISPFEQFLQNYPEGGVITFDEIGNMGSGSQHTSKESLLKEFYSMLDEGKWTSPLGETYDLRKFVIRFTSNEGQELFEGLPSDDLRMAAWKKANHRENLIQLLKKHDWPEALIARLQGNITLFRPSTEENRREIAKKMVDQTLNELKQQHHFKSFEVGDDFYSAIGESFFTHSEGARSMRLISTTELTDIFAEAIFDQHSDQDLRNTSFRVSLSDNYQGKYRFSGKIPFERQVNLTLTVETPGQADRVYQRNLADLAAAKKLVSQREALRIALHEAGHAVVNDPKQTGEAVDHITIRGQGGYGGYARYTDLPEGTINTNRGQAIAKIARILAGGITEELMSPTGRTDGWSSDKEKAARYAEKAVATYGLTDQALRLPVENGKVIVTHPKTQKEIHSILEEGRQHAMQRIQQNLPAIRTTAARLYRKGHLDREEFEEISQNLIRHNPTTRCLIETLSTLVVH